MNNDDEREDNWPWLWMPFWLRALMIPAALLLVVIILGGIIRLLGGGQ